MYERQYVKSIRIWSFSGSRIWTDTPYNSVFSPNAGNTDQKNSEYGHFSRSENYNVLFYVFAYAMGGT